MDSSGIGGSLFEQLRVGAPKADAGGGYVDLHDRLLRVAAVGFLVMVLLAPLMSLNEMTMSGAGNSARQIGYIAFLALTLWGSRPLERGLGIIAMPWPILLALGWCVLSLFWAVDPDIGSRRLLLTVLTIWTVFLLVKFGGYQSILDILRGALVVALLINYIVVFVDQPTGVHLLKDSAMPTALIGNWRGFMAHKNFAGAASALLILLFLFDAKRIPTLLRIAVIVAAGYFLFRTQSKTSAGMLGIAMLVGWMFQTLSRRLRSYLIPIVTIVTCFVWVMTTAYLDVLEVNYLEPSAFTGRGQIWAVLVRYATANPIYGAGFGSFWNIGGNSPVYSYGSGFALLVTVGHNGYLDLLVTVGLPGLALIVFAAIVWPMWRLLTSNRIVPARGAMLVAMLLFCMGHNITESSLFERDALVGVMMMFVVAFTQFATADLDERRVKGDAGDDVLRTMRRRRREAARLV
ncbi:O-antigen ligase family protein [Sphingomonas silueang]|uniref:O-antigen ligase family protein n=1 Tax=Sphingomonas silueang TaxID=3156617 RepID=UPI0032B54EE3